MKLLILIQKQEPIFLVCNSNSYVLSPPISTTAMNESYNSFNTSYTSLNKSVTGLHPAFSNGFAIFPIFVYKTSVLMADRNHSIASLLKYFSSKCESTSVTFILSYPNNV